MNWTQALSFTALSPSGDALPGDRGVQATSAACGFLLKRTVPERVIGWPRKAAAPAGILLASAVTATLTLNWPVPLVTVLAGGERLASGSLRACWRGWQLGPRSGWLVPHPAVDDRHDDGEDDQCT